MKRAHLADSIEKLKTLWKKQTTEIDKIVVFLETKGID